MTATCAYRRLADLEIQVLESQGCMAEDWRQVFVSPEFSTAYLCNVQFSGTVKVGFFHKEYLLTGGIKRHSGIFYATLHNVTIGQDCLIDHVGCIANYEIGEGTQIRYVSEILTEGETTFGNGELIEALSETGGREVRMYDDLSSHIAYIQALYRYQPSLVDAIDAAILEYALCKKSEQGYIGRSVKIEYVQTLKNLYIEDCAAIKGAQSLKNGTISSSDIAPTIIGDGVICDTFIIGESSNVSGGVTLNHCYVGEGCHLDHHFTATHSLFFANCQMENGEACALFAGPYSVSHHKSTLLIAAYCSFMNAGSNSNQSNHSYKLGPSKQGILDRGVKLGSGSYLFWPMHVGAYTTVIGHHGLHADLSSLPFSYLLETGSHESLLLPGQAMLSCGLFRDLQKWPNRDVRKSDTAIDQICFGGMTPYTAEAVIKAIELLESFKNKESIDSADSLTQSAESSYCFYQGVKIPAKAVSKGLKLYRQALYIYMYGAVVERMYSILTDQRYDDHQKSDISKYMTYDSRGIGHWTDMGGLLLPAEEVAEKLCQWRLNEEARLRPQYSMSDPLHQAPKDAITPLLSLQNIFEQSKEQYKTCEWNWVCSQIAQQYGIDIAQASAEALKSITLQWKDASLNRLDLLIEDAKKQYATSEYIGYGIDGDAIAAEQDFVAVRGRMDDDSLIQSFIDQRKDVEIKVHTVLDLL